MASRKRSYKTKSIIPALFFLSIFIAAGCAVLYFLTILPLWKNYQSQSWPKTTAIVDSAEIKTNHGDDSVSYEPVVHYHYFLDGARYEGDTFWFRTSNYSDKEALSKLMQPYREGAEVDCFYNPDLAMQSVLVREVSIGVFEIVFPTMFIGIPLFIAIAMLLSRPKSHVPNKSVSLEDISDVPRASTLASVQTIQPENLLSSDTSMNLEARVKQDSFRSSYCPHETEDKHGDKPFILEVQTSRRAVFIGILVVSLFWNCITYGILAAIVFDDGWQLFPLLVLLPFELIGLALVGGTVYSFLKLFNPKPAVVCSNSLLYPGSEFELSWTFSGRSQSVKGVKLNLFGVETVSYRQGTSTRTEAYEFFRKELFHATTREEIDEGFTVAQLPFDTMHTFTGTNNKVQWFTEIVGEIAYWPDVREKFEITVYPPKVSK